MKFKNLYLRLRKGKQVNFYIQGNDAPVTVEVTCKNDTFSIHSYVFEGEEITDDLKFVQYLKDEFTTNLSDFNALVAYLESKFPGINLDI
jgi:hypothetical protein